MKKLFVAVLISFVWIIPLHAQEGMWLFTQLDKLDLNKKGLKIDIGKIYNPDKPSITDAVVLLGGGTASFVSPEGLLLTNHHVAYTALQRSSTVNSDYLSKGFTAWTRPEEIQAPGYEALLMTKMSDVTDEILNAAKRITDPAEKEKKIDAKIAEMTDALEKDKSDVRANIADMYNGKQYILFVYQVFKDIRIVYSPPLAIGKFGGEIDNWMWPRHTGDFSFLRVYVSPDGKGEEYNQNNVPYKPKSWLKVAKDNLKDGDFTFTIGYPGFTVRYRTSNSANWNYRNNYPWSIRNYKEIIKLLDETTMNNPEGKLKVASLKNSLENTRKKYEGTVSAMKKTNFVYKKLAFEKKMMEWVNADKARKEKYGSILDNIESLYVELEKTKERNNIVEVINGFGGLQLAAATEIYAAVKELEKPESERDPGFNKKSIDRIIERLQYQYADYYEPAEKGLMIRALSLAADLPEGQRISELEYILSNKSISISQFVDQAFKESKLIEFEFAKSLFSKSSADLDAMNDAIITIAARMYSLNDKIKKDYQIFGAKVTDLRKQYLNALYEWKGKTLYPDANRTIRFTYGNVKGYTSIDAVWYTPFTTLKGVIDKNTGEEPFNVPPELTELFDNKDYGKYADPNLKDIPVAFIHLGDIAGGSSGSPIMNAKGELVGVAFDGNYEAMISDWQFDYDLQRVISVDIRYVLFVTDKFSEAKFILDEMGASR